MSLPVRHLPVVQNWDCHGCGTCCHEYVVTVTAEERQCIEAQGWDQEPDLAGVPLFVRSGPPWARRDKLNQRAEGACVFLSALGRCRIHEKFGAAAKPFPCRLYPFVLSPAGNHWRVGLRFSCPAAAGNKGKPLADQQADVEGFTPELERRAGREADRFPPPPLQAGQSVDWTDLLRFVQALQALLRRRDYPLEYRMRQCLALARICRQARFDEVKGSRLVDFLNLVGASLEDEVPADPAAVPPPARVGRLLFRQALALYPRHDHGPARSKVRGPVALVGAAGRFMWGRGPIPRIHGWLPETTFEKAEEPTRPLPAVIEEVLERYYTVKVGSLQFCGPAYFGFPFWEGFEALALTLPVILWLNRVLAGGSREEAVVLAIRMVDANYGFNPLLGLRRQRLGLWLMTRRQELDRLIAWYSR
jgi:lysine-N-methylase